MASSKILAVVKEGRQALAKFRALNPGMLLDLTDADLCGAELHGCNLRRALLVGAKLAGTNLEGANLSEADLTRANLKSAKLNGTDFRQAKLFKSMLSEADATEANFGHASLSGCDLSKARLTRAIFLEADLAKAELSDANLLGTDFSLARLVNVHAERLTCGWTRWTNCALSDVTGLVTATHHGPSSIGLDTWLRSRSKIPDDFLRGCGLTDDFIAALKAVPIGPSICFVRFSHEDRSFAERLAEDLRTAGVVCWLDEMPNEGRKELPLEAQFDSQQPNKVILLVSKSSLTSPWVEGEVSRLLEREQEFKKETGHDVKLLLPLTLDGFLFGGDAKGKQDKALAAHVTADFNGWRRNDTKFGEVFPKVLIALGVDRPRVRPTKTEATKSGALGWLGIGKKKEK